MPNTNDNEQLNIPSFLLHPVTHRVDTRDDSASKDEDADNVEVEHHSTAVVEPEPVAASEPEHTPDDEVQTDEAEPVLEDEPDLESLESAEDKPLDVIVLDRDDSAQVKTAAAGKAKQRHKPKGFPEPGSVRVLKPEPEEEETPEEPKPVQPAKDTDEPEPQATNEDAEEPVVDNASSSEQGVGSTDSQESEIEAMMASVMQAVQGIQESEVESTDEDSIEDDVNKKMEAALRAMSRFASLPTIESKQESAETTDFESEDKSEDADEPVTKATHEAEEAAEPEHADDSTRVVFVPEPAEEQVPEPTLEEDLDSLAVIERRLYAHRYASLELEAFGSSIDPIEAAEDRSEALAVLAEEDHELLSAPEVGDMLARLKSHEGELDPIVATQVGVLARDHRRIASVPGSLQAQVVRLTSESYEAWLKARESADWRVFAPYLDQLVSLKRKAALAQNPDADPYDTMLDEFEPGTNRAFYDEFFNQTKQAIVPLLHAIIASNRTMNQACIEGRFDERRQWDLSNDLCDLVGINKDAHYLTTTVHPYSEAMTSHYAVTATNIDASNIMGNVYTMLHELGHNLYEQGVNPAYNRTSLKGGTSMGMHEAQSRFFENLVGRDRAFMDPILELLRNRFPGQMGRVTSNQLYRAVNCVRPTLVRTEADEVTYSLHILIRYEIEQLLVSGKATARDVPQLWAQRYDSYLGIRPSDDLNGALQDVHWAMGEFGYFPAYALGNAYAAQLKDKILEDGIAWERVLQSGNLGPIREWLGKNIWWHGRSKDARTLIEEACGRPFDAKYYIDYLTSKYDTLYNLRLG